MRSPISLFLLGFPVRRPSRSGCSGSNWIFEFWISSTMEISQSLETLFQCLTILILRKKCLSCYLIGICCIAIYVCCFTHFQIEYGLFFSMTPLNFCRQEKDPSKDISFLDQASPTGHHPMNQFPHILHLKGLAHASSVWLQGYHRKPCFSQRKQRVLLSPCLIPSHLSTEVITNQAVHHSLHSGCSQTFLIFYVLWNIFEKEQLHKLTVFKRLMQGGWSLPLHKEPHRETKGHQVQVALRCFIWVCRRNYFSESNHLLE